MSVPPSIHNFQRFCLAKTQAKKTRRAATCNGGIFLNKRLYQA
jgi:hypothetical protein